MNATTTRHIAAPSDSRAFLEHLLDGPDDVAGGDAFAEFIKATAPTKSYTSPRSQPFTPALIEDLAPAPTRPGAAFRFQIPSLDLGAALSALVSGVVIGVVLLVVGVALLGLGALAFITITQGHAASASFAQSVTARVGDAPLILQIKDFIAQSFDGVTFGS
jgi:hypothetical protein